MKTWFSFQGTLRSARILGLLLIALGVTGAVVGLRAENTSAAAPAVAFSFYESEAILARIKAPVFPARDFPITDFGAVAGADSSAAIRKAIEVCNAAGGGRVVVPAGEWVTGAVHLKSNVNLYLEKGSTLRFSTDPAAYLPVVQTRWEGI